MFEWCSLAHLFNATFVWVVDLIYQDFSYFKGVCLYNCLFFKWANPGLFFGYFRLFYMKQIKYKFIKLLMVCLGLEPGAAGWKA